MKHQAIFITLTILDITGCVPGNTGNAMNKGKFTQTIAAMYNNGNMNLVEQLYDPDYVIHINGQNIRGFLAAKQGGVQYGKH